jgi:PAS domain S-box-containing protein
VTEVNDALLDMLGMTRTEFEATGLDWRTLHEPEFVPEFERVMATLRREGRVRPRELPLRAKSGAFVSVMASATRLEGGRDEHAAFLADLTPLKTAEAALRKSQQRFEQVMRSVSAIVYEVELRTGIVGWAANAWRVIGVGAEDIEPTVEWWLARVHPDDRPVLEAAIAEIKSGLCEQFELEYRLRHEEGHWLTIWDRAFLDREDGKPVGYVGCAVDITERKKSEERLKMLAGELDHRVKNILANIIAIIRHSKDEKSAEEYANAMLGRILAFGRAHELLRSAAWEGVPLRSLFETELAPFRTKRGRNVRLEGPDIVLAAPAAQSLAMASHELTTNAAKYGALSAPGGSLDVTWLCETRDGAPLLSIKWCESGGPAVKRPAHSGFGTLMLKKIVARQLGADVDLSFGKGGLVCTIVLGSPHFSKGKSPRENR